MLDYVVAAVPLCKTWTSLTTHSGLHADDQWTQCGLNTKVACWLCVTSIHSETWDSVTPFVHIRQQRQAASCAMNYCWDACCCNILEELTLTCEHLLGSYIKIENRYALKTWVNIVLPVTYRFTVTQNFS